MFFVDWYISWINQLLPEETSSFLLISSALRNGGALQETPDNLLTEVEKQFNLSLQLNAYVHSETGNRHSARG